MRTNDLRDADLALAFPANDEAIEDANAESMRAMTGKKASPKRPFATVASQLKMREIKEKAARLPDWMTMSRTFGKEPAK